MNVQRNKEIKAVVTALTLGAALASGFLTARDANAAPPSKKKSTITVKRSTKAKPVYVKMSGNRRAAEVRGQQLYSQALAQKAADEQAALDAQQQANTQETTTVVTSNTSPMSGGFNPYGGFVQQVNVPGFGGQGPIVVGGGGYGFGGFSGPSSFGGGFGFPNGGSGVSSVVGYPSSGPLFGGGGFLFNTGF